MEAVKGLGDRGKAVRKAFHLSQESFASLLGPGFTKSTISSWELGKTYPVGNHAMKYLIVIETMEEALASH